VVQALGGVARSALWGYTIGMFASLSPRIARSWGLALLLLATACGDPELMVARGDGGAGRADADMAEASTPPVDAALDAGLPGDSGPMLPDAEPPRPAPPTFPHLDNVVDMMRGSVPAWVEFIYVRDPEGSPEFFPFAYEDTSARHDFWPASTIKIYTATAALVLLHEYGLSLDTEATFSHRSGPTDAWVEDTTITFRRMIFDVFDHSSNSAYTLLLRFAGIDWLNGEFFTEANGFQETALLVGYVSDRPWRYIISEEQRIVLRHEDRTMERTHDWSGTRYDNTAGCTVRYGTYANCSSPRDMAEHMRRLMFHEASPAAERFLVREADLDWMRYGDAEPVMNQAASGWSHGLRRVLPDALYYHKAGRVGSYALDLHYVDDTASGTYYVAAIATESAARATYDDLSEAVARMVRTPHAFISLDPLRDYVNPITADLYVYAASPGTLELIVKPYAEDAADPGGWLELAGASMHLAAGEHSLGLRSSCLGADARYHIRGRFTPDDGSQAATSDLHYVIADADVPCP